jgi:Transposase zinc-binding domain
MTRPGLEVGDVFRAYEPELPDPFEGTWSVVQRRAFRDLAQCRTAVLGGHVDACDQCAYQRISYNSCRNRHCPKCQAMAGADWMAARAEDLLPVEYYHVVFTIPEELDVHFVN